MCARSPSWFIPFVIGAKSRIHRLEGTLTLTAACVPFCEKSAQYARSAAMLDYKERGGEREREISPYYPTAVWRRHARFISARIIYVHTSNHDNDALLKSAEIIAHRSRDVLYAGANLIIHRSCAKHPYWRRTSALAWTFPPRVSTRKKLYTFGCDLLAQEDETSARAIQLTAINCL